MTSSTASPSFFSTLAAKAKAHHEGINAAFNTYYSGGYGSPANSQPASRRASHDSMEHAKPQSPSNASKAWKSVKKHIKEHHQGMNAAYSAYYGNGSSPSQSRSNSTFVTPRASTEC